MRTADDIARELRAIELELIELELSRHREESTAADHARALLFEVRRLERVARQTQR